MRLNIALLTLFFVVCAVCAKSTTTPDESDPDYVEDDYATNGNDDMDGEEEDYDNGTEEEEENFVEPTIESRSLNIEAKEGQTIDLPCDTRNADLYVIMWKKNNKTITQGKSIFGSKQNIVVFPNSTLQLKNIQESDAGDYTCVVVVSQTFNVNITHRVLIDAPPRIISLTASNSKIPLQAGDDLQLTCKASGEPQPKIKWYFEHKYKGMKEEAKNDMISEGENLTIENIGYDRTGYYRCLADNGSKNPAHESIFIDVVHKPVVNIEKIYSNDTLHELVCVVHATPLAKVHWEKDGKNIISNNHLKLSIVDHEHRVTFASFQGTDEGKYTCIATNDVGEDTYAVQISRVPEQPHLSTSKPHKNKEYTLEWVVHSHMPILESVVSYKEKGQTHEKEVFGKLTHKDNNDFTISYIFTDLKRGSYSAKMKAKNHYGWSMYSQETHFNFTGTRHSHKNKHQGSHMKDNDVMNRAESHTEEKEPENQEDNTRTGSQVSQDSGTINLLPSVALLFVNFVLLLLRP